ncbi:RNA polymerase sigma factor [Paenibacillus alvei]|uniref:RNA polymerase sigma factor n=1 Tax=Paenibacillus alvei TaxID=44250 RepID=A0AAP7A3W0_PAEAL|nr:RNA polymerase sigma factor [Paenibacillus alvei]MBG9737875.1 hypothetical protein [Paenibacillus alvei]MBG9747567.1 hypothetical protein [Paenibacillus alvei]MCY9580894.1 RNA polymerase sigma factor [Paenibacillus alvei]MCY9585612.1 RNA polymerase sigma factor [Paenibacillus alvei]MCY9759106.1 RNA polymerase sigma factor [Paenibacillus alvei]
MSIVHQQSACSKASLINFSQLSNQIQAQIYNEYCHSYYHFVYSMIRNHHSTEDILQEAFLRLITKKLSHVNDDKLYGWIFTLTRNVAINYIRKQKKHGIATNMKELQMDTLHPQMISEWDYLKRFEVMTVQQYMNDLAPQLRTIMYLRFMKQLSYKEISAALHITEGAVRQNLYRGRKIIKERYLQEFEEHMC